MNLDNNFNGYGDDQGSSQAYIYGGVATAFPVDCPIDLNGDHICDEGGCLRNFGLTVNYASLYELDFPLGTEPVTILYIDPSCCSLGIPPLCTWGGCGSAATSASYGVVSSTNPGTGVSAQFYVYMWAGAYFSDPTGACDPAIDPRYRCH